MLAFESWNRQQARPLDPASLRRCCAPTDVPFETTAQAAELDEIVGQERAAEAVRFGAEMRHEGYNLFVIGPPGTGKETLIRQCLGRQAAKEATPSDWCYVHNFEDAHRPRTLRLPAGTGPKLRQDLERLIADLRLAIPAAFDSEDYRNRKHQLTKAFKERQETAFAAVQSAARLRNVAVVRTDAGMLLAPLRDGQVLEPEAFGHLPTEEREQLGVELERTREELAGLIGSLHDWERQHRLEVQALDRTLAAAVVRRHVGKLDERYRELPQVRRHLDDIEKDAIANVAEFLDGQEEGVEAALRHALQRTRPDGLAFRRYQVNVVVDHSTTEGAPVVFEDNPSYANLVGRVEHVSELGTLVTDFMLIRPGALQRANGGHLIIEAVKLLQQPFAWDALKRALRSREVRIEAPGQLLGLVATPSLESQPIPLDRTKVVLVGDRSLYYLMATLDPDVPELFKVIVDFEEAMERRPDTIPRYAQLVATLARREGLRPLDRGAVARVLDQAARMAGDSEKLSVQMRPIVDLMREADLFAGRAGRPVTNASDVEDAVAAQAQRSGRIRDRLLEQIRHGTLLVDTNGERVAQVNGLSVVRLGALDLGHPTRITARVRVGKGEVLDIEREVALGGPIHSKGVLILAGFLGARYAGHTPLALAASLVFEQSYAPVEGDSASLGELCALLSALAELPVRQSLAVTGSVDQHGQVQAVGGINEKIEGFYDACCERGLTGDQGVVLPRSNVRHLMLRPDVVNAAAAGRFHVYPVETVDEAIGLLTGRPPGDRDDHGFFPVDSVNALVEARLAAFAEDARTFARPPDAR